MRFEWDDNKRVSNLDKHGIDFVDAELVFDGRSVVTVPSPYLDEVRTLTTGFVEGRLITVVWTEREDAIRIISARRARDAEVREYREVHRG
ncbi:MAG: BrnT family toxin [Chloroflexota bacterium]|nr:BrnT family toxin [Chloroflexota bacterium]